MGRNVCRYVQWGPPHVYEMDSQHLILSLLGLEVEGIKKPFMKETGKLFNPYPTHFTDGKTDIQSYRKVCALAKTTSTLFFHFRPFPQG